MPRQADVHDTIVIGAESVLGAWVSAFVREACVRASPSIEVRQAGRDHDCDDIGRLGGPPRVLMVQHPNRAVIDAIEPGRVSVIGVLDDPVDSVRFVQAVKHCDLPMALRHQTSSASANHLLRQNAAVTLIHRSTVSARDVATVLVGEIGLALSEADGGALMEEFCGSVDDPWSLETALQNRVGDYAHLDRLSETISADQAKLVRQVLSPMVLGAISDEIATITWPSGVFLFGDKPDEVAPPVADVTGGARIIYYGPYFHLPPGGYQVKIVVAFSVEARGTPFRLTMFCEGRPIAKIVIRPSDGGAFEGVFTMRHKQPEHNIEVHFMNDEGVLEGHMALGLISFTRQPD